MYGHKIRVIIPSYNCRLRPTAQKKPEANRAIVLLIFGEVDISRTLSIKRGLGLCTRAKVIEGFQKQSDHLHAAA